MSDINTAVVDSLKVLDLKRPIREADSRGAAPFPVAIGEQQRTKVSPEGENLRSD